MDINSISESVFDQAAIVANNLANNSSSTNSLGIVITLFSIIGTILIGISVLPQTIKIVRDHQSLQVNKLMYIFLVLGTLGLGIYGIALISTGVGISNQYLSHQNLTYLINQNGTGVLENFSGPSGHFISPSAYKGHVINYVVPGAMLVAGEFFAAITSGIVLWYKLANIYVAKKNNTTEENVCLSFAKEHPSRMQPMFKYHGKGGK